MSRTVGHFVENYLPLTETFIYQYATSHERYDPFICSTHSENLDKFPFEVRHTFLDLSKLNPRFWTYGFLAKVGIAGIETTYYGDVIDAHDPNILHAHFGPVGVEMLDHRTDQRPLVTSFYGYDASRIMNEDESIQDDYEMLFQIGDRFLVEGPSMEEKLLNMGCPSEKIELQRIAIDAASIEPQYPTEEEGFRVLMVGRFVEKKGMPDGIRAFATAFNDDPDAELRIVGGPDGELTRDDLEAVADECGIRDKIEFTGYLDHQQYLMEVRQCDIVLAPSKRAESGDSEGGAPTVLLEGQASGKPIVATTHADIPYVVENEVAGKLTPPGDINAISDALTWFRSNPRKLSEMGKAGRQNVLERHNVARLATQLELLYDELC